MILFILVSQVIADCIQDSYLSIPKSAEWVYAINKISIRLEGEYIIGYGEDYTVKDKNKIQLKKVPQGDAFGPTNFEIYCPPVHQISKSDNDCEIKLNMYQINATDPEFVQLIFPIEQEDDIRDNPIFEINDNFQMRLVDLAKQLERMAFYLEYVNCNQTIYYLPDALEVPPDQLTLLKQYATSLPDGTNTTTIENSNKGELYVENYTTDTGSNTHLYGLAAIIIGVVVLAAIRVLRKHNPQEHQNNNNQNDQELPILK